MDHLFESQKCLHQSECGNDDENQILVPTPGIEKPYSCGEGKTSVHGMQLRMNLEACITLETQHVSITGVNTTHLYKPNTYFAFIQE